MIDVSRCNFEEAYINSVDEFAVFYYYYPKDLSEVEFCSEEEYGEVVFSCIALTIYPDRYVTMQMSPTVIEDGVVVDVDWRDLEADVNYTYDDVYKLVKLTEPYTGFKNEYDVADSILSLDRDEVYFAGRD